ncbi:FtsX-like permease family protein [Amycolatopsis rubida]|uniref:FtsX-like permease family protein n=1 Tax=Amycolatopsis rubida TaxID=112413 RepID=A0A1I6APL5_9PSEU|nr:FtsX-like permease family protein [Amycolatopsis rubida]SFQ70634.1 FtsX-like permease family protein [Amycolatopsis rubida]
MMRDLLLGLRLAVGGGRMSGSALLRLAMTAFGIALAVAVLLPAASVSHLVNARADRAAAIKQDTAPREGIAPLATYRWYPSVGEDYLLLTAVAATGENSPVPPGLSRLPAPGEVIVSPALAEKLNSAEGASIKARLPGNVVGQIAEPGVGDAADLTAYYGSTAAEIKAEGENASSVYAYGKPAEGFALSAIMWMVVAPIAAVLLLPLLIFVTTASRMGAAQRERRLAALRLVGVDARQIKRVAAAESLVGAVIGLVAGGALFYALRPFIGDWLPFGLRVFADDFTPSWVALLVIVLLVPGLAVGSALFGLRRTIVEPLGVVRQGKPVRRRMWWRWTVTGIGAVFLLGTLVVSPGSGDQAAALALAVGSVFLLIGVAALLPWLVERIVERLQGGPPSWQLAVRRLQLDSGTASRVVSGLVVVLAGTILIQGVLTSMSNRSSRSYETPAGVAAAPVRVDTTSAHEAEVRERLSGVAGVTGVHRSQSLQLGSGERQVYGTVGDCVALKTEANIGDCADGDVFYVAGSSAQAAPKGDYRLMTYRNGHEVEGPQWTVPGNVRVVPSGNTAKASVSSLLITPSAFGDVKLPGERTQLLVAGTGGADALIDRVAAAVRPLAWKAEVGKTDLMSDYAGRDDRMLASFRAVLLTASLFVLAVAAMSLLMLSIEQISERRRPLAALSAAGVPIGVLARGSLWQTAVPVVVGVVLAVGAGLGLTAPILRLAKMPMMVDGGVLAGLAGAAVAAVLLVTALTLPLLRQVTRLDTLRSE